MINDLLTDVKEPEFEFERIYEASVVEIREYV